MEFFYGIVGTIIAGGVLTGATATVKLAIEFGGFKQWRKDVDKWRGKVDDRLDIGDKKFNQLDVDTPIPGIRTRSNPSIKRAN